MLKRWLCWMGFKMNLDDKKTLRDFVRKVEDRLERETITIDRLMEFTNLGDPEAPRILMERFSNLVEDKEEVPVVLLEYLSGCLKEALASGDANKGLKLTKGRSGKKRSDFMAIGRQYDIAFRARQLIFQHMQKYGKPYRDLAYLQIADEFGISKSLVRHYYEVKFASSRPYWKGELL